ncbi:hypothetical protein TNCV_2067941 [Trichonephila clavipes]|uniref:Uncharacterized protein n=1 Tax=Trichonephila clavipes TaxID=2585209 RepID=A0A8X6W2N1_TRICX|nr:hypothetical protein TNCV_2067941 [Trichonephila clavipes]
MNHQVSLPRLIFSLQRCRTDCKEEKALGRVWDSGSAASPTPDCSSSNWEARREVTTPSGRHGKPLVCRTPTPSQLLTIFSSAYFASHLAFDQQWPARPASSAPVRASPGFYSLSLELLVFNKQVCEMRRVKTKVFSCASFDFTAVLPPT